MSGRQHFEWHFLWLARQIYRKGLTRMFEDQDRDALFLETCMNPKGQRHMAMECVPLPKDIGDMAPIYFKVGLGGKRGESLVAPSHY